MRTVELMDGGILPFNEAFLPSEIADRYFAELLDNCAWVQKPEMFGHVRPRPTAY